MTFPSLLFLVLAVVPAITGAKSQTQSPTCLRYEPGTVDVTGTLTRMTFPGRPNYASIKEGDEPESGFYLQLSTAICTIGSADSANDNNGSLEGIHLVQLVLDSAGYTRLRPQLGRKITLRGTLFAALSGHHHAPVLLRVDLLP